MNTDERGSLEGILKALVIGGTLFIGRRLVQRLLEEGHDVAVLHRREEHSLGPNVENLVADRNDTEQVRQALAGRRFDWVFDNVYDWDHGTTADHVTGTARACGDVKRYVFMSSVAAYVEGMNRSEDCPLAPPNDPSSYAANKAESERALFRMHQDEGLPAVTLRPPYVYGPENPFYRESFFWDRLTDGRPVIVPGDGKRLMQFVFVHDLAEACLLAAKKPEAAGEAFNIANDEPVTQEEVVMAVARVSGYEPTLVYVPREIILAAGGDALGPGNLYFAVYFDIAPITQKTDKARTLLGFEPTPFEEGLRITYEWYREHHRRPEIDYRFEDRLIREASGGTGN